MGRPGARPLHPLREHILREQDSLFPASRSIVDGDGRTRLVHVFSARVGYLTRPHIVYRSRDDQLGSRSPERAGRRPAKPR